MNYDQHPRLWHNGTGSHIFCGKALSLDPSSSLKTKTEFLSGLRKPALHSCSVMPRSVPFSVGWTWKVTILREDCSLWNSSYRTVSHLLHMSQDQHWESWLASDDVVVSNWKQLRKSRRRDIQSWLKLLTRSLLFILRMTTKRSVPAMPADASSWSNTKSVLSGLSPSAILEICGR